MKAHSLFTVFTLLLLTVGCAHELSEDYPDKRPNHKRVTLSDQWTAKGKLLITTQDTNQSARFVWEHHPSAGDTITLGDTLSLRTMVLRHRNDTLFLQQPDQTLVQLTPERLPKEFGALLSIPPRDFASALTGEPLVLPAIASEVRAWQSIGTIDAPRTVRLQSSNIVVKVVINHWELIEDV